MLILDLETGEYGAEKTPIYGKDRLEEFSERVIREGMRSKQFSDR